MDVTPFLQVRPAPRAVFDELQQRHARPRYMLPLPDGGWRPLTWARHAQDIRNLAMFLIRRGYRPSGRAAIFSPNSHLWIAAALGIEAAGMVMVPIYPASTADQAGYVVGHSGAQVVFVGTPELTSRILLGWSAYDAVDTIVVLDDTDPVRVATDLREAGERVPSDEQIEQRFIHVSQACAAGVDLDASEPKAFERALHALDLDQPAIMLYTSGTTGDPKGVPLTHRNVGVNAVDWLQCNAKLLPEDGVDVLWLPMSHIFGLGEACLGNTLGWTTYLAEPATVLDLLPQVRPNIFMSVPAYWAKLGAKALQAPNDDAAKAALVAATGGRLQFCLSGGAGLEREVKELFLRGGTLIVEGYGLTECSPTLTLNRPDDFRLDSVGKPLPSVQLRLLDDGEIVARGPSVFGGYHEDPKSTADAFTEDGWFRTGDIGRFTEDGFLQIVDRKKEILVTAGGKNVPPANVERLFDAEPLLSHVVVYGDGKKYLTAGMWLDETVAHARLAEATVAAADRGQTLEAWVQRAVEAANAKLARHEQIKRFKIMSRPLTVADGLLTSTLKIRRKKIYAAFRDEYEELYR